MDPKSIKRIKLEGMANNLGRTAHTLTVVALEKNGCAGIRSLAKFCTQTEKAVAKTFAALTEEEHSAMMALCIPEAEKFAQHLYEDYFGGPNWKSEIEPLLEAFKPYRLSPKIGVIVVLEPIPEPAKETRQGDIDWTDPSRTEFSNYDLGMMALISTWEPPPQKIEPDPLLSEKHFKDDDPDAYPGSD